MAKRPANAKQTNANVQRDIRLVLEEMNFKVPTLSITSRCKAENDSKASTASIVTNCTTEACTSTSSSTLLSLSSSSSPYVPSEQKMLLKNTYARELFFRYTNIMQIVAKKLPERSERTRQHYAKQLYQRYILQPKYRIRETLEAVRFDTRFHEGLFRMALKVPIVDAQDHAIYNRNLARAGVKKLCFVDMTDSNCVLEDQAKLIIKLKSDFKHWSNKLDKIKKYLNMYQAQRELDDKRFVSLLKRHSSLKGACLLNAPDVLEQLVCEARLPSEKREHPLWLQLTFDTDALNQEFGTGVYSKMQRDLEIEPEEIIDYGALNRSRTELTQDVEVPEFVPFICSTQNQSHASEAFILPPIEIKDEIGTSTQSSSTMSPLQAVEPFLTGATNTIPMVSIPVAGVKKEQLNTEAAPVHNEDMETITLSSSPDGRLNRPTAAEQRPITPPRIGPYITIQAGRNHKRPPLLAATEPRRLSHSNSLMLFLNFIDVQSIRYTNIPTTWPQCNVFQQNPLTINLNPRCPGIFSVPIRDQQACQLLGLSAGGKGRAALLAALAHVGKFRYGSKEPAKEYYRLSVTEKVLHLFFAIFPPCPQDGGVVMFFKSKSSLPADGDEVWLERFNYYAHTNRTGVKTVAGNTNDTGEMLANMLLPGIAQKMRSLREKLIQAND